MGKRASQKISKVVSPALPSAASFADATTYEHDANTAPYKRALLRNISPMLQPSASSPLPPPPQHPLVFTTQPQVFCKFPGQEHLSVAVHAAPLFVEPALAVECYTEQQQQQQLHDFKNFSDAQRTRENHVQMYSYPGSCELEEPVFKNSTERRRYRRRKLDALLAAGEKAVAEESPVPSLASSTSSDFQPPSCSPTSLEDDLAEIISAATTALERQCRITPTIKPPDCAKIPVALVPRCSALSEGLVARCNAALPESLYESSSHDCAACPVHGTPANTMYSAVFVAPLPSRRSHGFVAVGCADTIGRRGSMEDSMTVCSQYRGHDGEHFFGLYDGHGGNSVSKMAGTWLHRMLGNWLSGDDNDDIARAMHGAFAEFEQHIESNNVPATLDCMSNGIFAGRRRGWQAQYAAETGCTALAVYMRGLDCWVANAGDCRAVLGADIQRHLGGSQFMHSRRVTTDHKPASAGERARIEAAGGYITLEFTGKQKSGGDDGDDNDDQAAGRLNGVLGVSRAFGNIMLRPAVTHVPDVFHVNTASYDVLILACDGLWDVLSDDDAVRIALSQECPGTAAQQLVQAAYNAGSDDNISVIVVRLPGNTPAFDAE